jgi:hypothetical protein
VIATGDDSLNPHHFMGRASRNGVSVAADRQLDICHGSDLSFKSRSTRPTSSLLQLGSNLTRSS